MRLTIRRERQYQAWAHWQASQWPNRAVKQRHRPPGLPKQIPRSWWDRYRRERPHQAPPVPAPRPSVPPAEPAWPGVCPIPLPLMFTAWGFREGGTTWSSAAQLAGLLEAARFRSVALQIGAASPGDAEVLRSRGLRIILWGVASSEDAAALAAFQADGYLPQAEGQAQYDAMINNLAVGVGRDLPKACVTTLGLYPAAAVEHGAGCALVECYAPEGRHPYGDLGLMTDQARRDGWAAARPVIGLYHGVGVDAYPELAGWGREYGVWLAEELTAADWLALASA